MSPADSSRNVAAKRAERSDANEASAEPSTPPAVDVETSLADALSLAAIAGRFDVVGQLAHELEARRLARAGNVVRLDGEGRRRR